MPKMSSVSADNIQDYGPVEDRSGEVDGYTINFVTFREAQDITQILASLSEGKCMCPHWGYVFKGKMTVAYDNGTEDVVESGDAFFAPAGHTSWKTEAGTELLQISPSKELAEVEAAINEVMGRMQEEGPA
jgi:hypothetical protein